MKRYEVEVESFEAILPGGVHHVSWQVDADGEWRPVAELGQPLTLDEQRAPGLVWRRRFSLQLALGTKLMKIESKPAARTGQDPLAYLWKGARHPERRVVRSYFEVSAGGRLIRRQPKHGR